MEKQGVTDKRGQIPPERNRSAGAAFLFVLFLDVDGVLIPQVEDRWTETLDTACVGHIQRIEAVTGVKVVLSSLWRHSREKRLLLERSGIALYGVTPVLGGEPRAAEIAAWLREAQARGILVADYVILDDNDDAAIEGHFVSVDAHQGVTETVADVIITRFRRRSNL